jgi:hypothetical protein
MQLQMREGAPRLSAGKTHPPGNVTEDSAHCVGCYASHITVVLSKANNAACLCVCEREPPAHFACLVPERTSNVQQACCTLREQRELQA